MRLCVVSSSQLQVAPCLCHHDLILGYITRWWLFNTFKPKLEKLHCLAVSISFSVSSTSFSFQTLQKWQKTTRQTDRETACDLLIDFDFLYDQFQTGESVVFVDTSTETCKLTETLLASVVTESSPWFKVLFLHNKSWLKFHGLSNDFSKPAIIFSLFFISGDYTFWLTDSSVRLLWLYTVYQCWVSII